MISILVTTFNRPTKLRRCLDSIIRQTYTDFEIILIDDASTEINDLPLDERIKCYRNKENQGAEHGDRIHLKRFVHELAKGKYFVYLCDDDYWIPNNLLARQIALFEAYPDASMVIGGQMSDFGTHKEFHRDIYPQAHMISREFLDHFSKHPTQCNIIIGATLYDMEKFKQSGALSGKGAKWQAGYEMLMAPACHGDVLYIDEPCVLTEITPENQSFQRSQREHYFDCVASVKAAKLPVDIEKETLYNIGAAYLRNAAHIKEHGSLTMCSPENIAEPVTEADLVTL